MSNVTQYTKTDSDSQPDQAEYPTAAEHFLSCHLTLGGLSRAEADAIAHEALTLRGSVIDCLPVKAIRAMLRSFTAVADAQEAAKKRLAKARRVAAKQQADEESSRRLNALFN